MVEVRIDLSSSMIKTRIFATFSAFSAPQPSMDRGSAPRADRGASRGDTIPTVYCNMHDNSYKNRRVQTTCPGVQDLQNRRIRLPRRRLNERLDLRRRSNPGLTPDS